REPRVEARTVDAARRRCERLSAYVPPSDRPARSRPAGCADRPLAPAEPDARRTDETDGCVAAAASMRQPARAACLDFRCSSATFLPASGPPEPAPGRKGGAPTTIRHPSLRPARVDDAAPAVG